MLAPRALPGWLLDAHDAHLSLHRALIGTILRARWLPLLLAAAFLALHLPYLPASLDDVDSINFALGVRNFDVAHHQPHPPGYPLFILAAADTTASAFASEGITRCAAFAARMNSG